MSMMIQVSYEEERELLAVTERLRDLPLKVSRKAYQSGKCKRVYFRSDDAEDKIRSKTGQ